MRPDYEKDYSLISLDSHELAAINHDLEATPGRDSRIEFIASPLQKALGIRTLEYMLLMLLVSLLSGSLDPAVIQARFLSSYYYFAIVIVVEAGFLITTEILDRHFHRLSYKITARVIGICMEAYLIIWIIFAIGFTYGMVLVQMMAVANALPLLFVVSLDLTQQSCVFVHVYHSRSYGGDRT
eukprot:TRINITY_DN7371_c0_g1_i2.p2 TRINITY_DN7371_c0_g1~~TRINITY_DN7371_c0_g1_i2.p2  ORF type:complete len:183 (-),score=17.48 TRINITY_DN7371_c0_g1_i2:466-1014(-)